jgi:hypothetical protein
MHPRPFLIRNLLSFNLPPAGLLAVPVALAVNIWPWHGCAAVVVAGGNLLAAVPAAIGLTCLELRLFRRAHVIGARAGLV